MNDAKFCAIVDWREDCNDSKAGDRFFPWWSAVDYELIQSVNEHFSCCGKTLRVEACWSEDMNKYGHHLLATHMEPEPNPEPEPAAFQDALGVGFTPGDRLLYIRPTNRIEVDDATYQITQPVVVCVYEIRIENALEYMSSRRQSFIIDRVGYELDLLAEGSDGPILVTLYGKIDEKNPEVYKLP